MRPDVDDYPLSQASLDRQLRLISSEKHRTLLFFSSWVSLKLVVAPQFLSMKAINEKIV
jgi:hypothetical protein